MESFDVIKELAAGVLADAAVLKLNYAAGAAPDCPETIVVKYQKPDPAQRANAVTGEFYDKECRFYQNIQPIFETLGVSLDTPICYGCEQKDDETFMICMQNLNVGYSPCSWQGYTLKQATELVEDIAEVHAKFWGHDLLNDAQLNGRAEKDSEGRYKFVHAIRGPLYDGLSKFTANMALWEEAMQEKFEPPVDMAKRHPVLETLFGLGEANAKKFIEAMELRLTPRPRTLVHGDMRCDNAFQPDDPTKRIKMIDWQTFVAAPPSQECLQLLFVMDKCDHQHTPGLIEKLHSEICKHRPSVAEEYPVDLFYEDVILMMCVHMYAIVGILCPVLAVVPKGHVMYQLMGYAFGTGVNNLMTALDGEAVLNKFLKENDIKTTTQ